MAELGEGQRGRATKEIEEAVMEVGRNLMLGKFPGIQKDDS